MSERYEEEGLGFRLSGFRAVLGSAWGGQKGCVRFGVLEFQCFLNDLSKLLTLNPRP